MGMTPRGEPTAKVTTKAAENTPGTCTSTQGEDDSILPPSPGVPQYIVTYVGLGQPNPLFKTPRWPWMLENGASIHLVNDLSLLHNVTIYDTPRPLHMATPGAVGGIVASGDIH